MYNSELYHNNNDIQQETARNNIEKYGRRIVWKNYNNIIDLGCGDGTVTTVLKNYLPKDVKVLGCDIDDGMVHLANKYHGDENTSFKVLDITGNLPEEMKGAYSHVFSFFAINWVLDQESSFKNIYNLLEPNGECFLLIVSSSPVFSVYRKLVQQSKWKEIVYDLEKYISPYHDSQDPETDVKLLMEKIGFNNIFAVNDQMNYTFRNLETMIDTLKAICPFKIPENLRNDFWKDYVKELKSIKGCDEVSEDIKFYHNVLTVHGRKPSVL